MITELINTGSELMLGRVLNTHQQWLCGRLADLGLEVNRQVAVPDRGADIQNAVRESLGRADLILVTGGLGPTADDLTRDMLAELLGRKLREDPAVLAHIRAFFAARNREMPERTRVQAMVPEGALVLENPHGTAPGLVIQVRPNPFRSTGETSWVILLPGPPRELCPMFSTAVVPILQKVLPPALPFACRTLRSTGIGESMMEEQVGPMLALLAGAGLEVGYCARPGQVDVRLVARGAEASRLVAEAEIRIRSRLGGSIYSAEDEELEAAVVRLLAERRLTLAVAESCTGGCLGHRLTNVPGASAVLLAGFITYSNAAKQKFLGVEQELLAAHGAVSEPVARRMAEGARSQTGADYALSLTGIAGPGGGSPEKPVGTVFIGLAGPSGTVVQRFLNPWDRLTFKHVSSQQALDLLRRCLQGLP